jgi:hypothetical protein
VGPLVGGETLPKEVLGLVGEVVVEPEGVDVDVARPGRPDGLRSGLFDMMG